MTMPNPDWSVSRLTAEFRDPVAEASFRARYRSRQIRQVAVSLFVIGLLFLAFAYPDYVALGPGRLFLLLLTVRVAIAAVLAAFALAALRRPWLVERGYPLTAVELLTFAAYFVVIFARPHDLAWHLGVFITMIIGLFIFVPNRVIYMGLAAVCAVPAFLFSIHVAHGVHGAELASVAMLMAFPVIIGFVSAYRFSSLRRREFVLLAQAERTNTLLADEITRRQELEVELSHLASTDPLTGLYNRRQFETLFEQEVRRARRHGGRLSVALLDLDHFKRVNDGYGHAAGDEALRMLADMCRQRLRESDVIARFGGEEFVVLLVDTALDQAVALLDSLREDIAGRVLQTDSGPLRLTVTMGVAEWRRPDESMERLLARADLALYAGKSSGRNRVVAA